MEQNSEPNKSPGCSGFGLKYIEPAYILISIAGGALVMTHRQYLYDRVSILTK